MKSFFLNPQQPLSTCRSTTCEGCPLQQSLTCHFNGRLLLRFFAIAFPPFILGGIGIVRISTWLLLPWIVLLISYFGLIEIRVMCSHCPHYAQPGTTSLQCWANYGSPKLWKFRPGPLNRMERSVFFVGLIIIAAYPLIFIIIGQQWLLLLFFILTTGAMAFLMGRFMCSHCMNFACPFNGVDAATQEAFFSRNPVISRAWQKDLNLTSKAGNTH
jgi:hypothetical protein